jgi:outer membrane protein assembly factor BamD
MRQFLIPFLFIGLAMGLVQCTPYSKALKNGTPEEKLAMAKKMYEKEDYYRALPLLEDLMGLYTGRIQREEIYYLFCKSNFGVEQYQVAAYHFKNFSETYATGKYAEEAAFMHAECFYFASLPHELDQSNTKTAIEKMQLFVNEHPTSEYVVRCNERIDQLRKKLLVKAYDNAKLWYNLGDYKAASVACQNAIYDYPDIIQKEELEYLTVDALFQYAKNSVRSKQVERFEAVKEASAQYFKQYQEGATYFDRVKKLNKKATEEIRSLNKSSNP